MPINISYRSALALLALALFSIDAAADDRRLFQVRGDRPYVMWVLDISGSMNRDIDRDHLPATGDDPNSKLYQAKKAIYEVITDVGNDVIYGWSTFNRVNLRVYRKQYLYTVDESSNVLPGWLNGLSGLPLIFGEPETGSGTNDIDAPGLPEDSDTSDGIHTYGDCDSRFSSNIFDVIADWPKLGSAEGTTADTHFYYVDGGTAYRMRWVLDSGTLGDIPLSVRVHRETIDDCSPETYTEVDEELLSLVQYYDQDVDNPVLAIAQADFLADTGSVGNGTFSIDSIATSQACGTSNNSTTSSWDWNCDNDTTYTYDVTPDLPLDRAGFGASPCTPTVQLPLGGSPPVGDPLAIGDLIPWDWDPSFASRTRDEILFRLAPNRSQGEPVPDFTIGRYFAGEPSGGVLPLLPAYADRPPLVGGGNTPIEGSIRAMASWHSDWEPLATNAVFGDDNFVCRERFLIIVTDGADTCSEDQRIPANCSPISATCEAAVCDAAEDLRVDEGVKSFVVGFGLSAAEEIALECIADRGGTGTFVDNNGDGIYTPGIDGLPVDTDGDGLPDGPGPIFATNKDELVDALLDIFVEVEAEATAVAAAAVPSVQSEVADKIFLTEFTPYDDKSVWEGTVQAAVKPLRFKSDGTPDLDTRCNGTTITSGCLAWDAQEELLAMTAVVPTPRKIYYSEFPRFESFSGDVEDRVPLQRREYAESVELGAATAIEEDIWRGFGITWLPADPASVPRMEANTIISETLAIKSVDLDNGTTREYVLGDFFHSDPLLLTFPDNENYFREDLGGELLVNCEGDLSTDSDNDPNVGPFGMHGGGALGPQERATSYRCFAIKNRFRRKLLFIGANDGMLHVFDAGQYDPDEGRFDDGTGRELFAYVPRPVMPEVKQLMVDDPTQHNFTVDGPAVFADVLTDPIHSGFFAPAGEGPQDDERIWRTVVVGGLRRGGEQNTADVPATGESDIRNPIDVVDKNISRNTTQDGSGYYALDVTEPDKYLTDLSDSDTDGDGQPDLFLPDNPPRLDPLECLGDPDGSGLPGAPHCRAEGYPVGIPFASPLWEFYDTISGDSDTNLERVWGLRLDEDLVGSQGHGFVDLAPTWSPPLIGRIRACVGVCDPTAPEYHDGSFTDPDPAVFFEHEFVDRYVAVFGGGFDSELPHVRGNFLYMVDMETGQTLYKQAVAGSVAVRPVATQTVGGYIDQIYFGTTTGLFYRLDMLPEIDVGLGPAFPEVRIVPQIILTSVVEDVETTDAMAVVTDDTLTKAVLRIEPILVTNVIGAVGEGAGAELYRPYVLFNANDNIEVVRAGGGGTFTPDELHGLVVAGLEPRPIFLPPSVFFVAEAQLNAIALGSGDRENLHLFNTGTNVIATFLDDIDDFELRQPTFVALDREDLRAIDSALECTDPLVVDFNANYLLDEPDPLDPSLPWSHRGWQLEFGPQEKLIGEPLTIFGLLFFSSFIVQETGLGECGDQGVSHLFGVFSENACGFLACEDDPSDLCRENTTSGLTTSPFSQQTQTGNPDPSHSQGDPRDPAEDLLEAERLRKIREYLKSRFPDECVFPPGFGLDTSARAIDRQISVLAEIPLCVIPSGWKEF